MVNCLLCQKNQTEIVGIFNNVEFLKCNNCHSVFKNPSGFVTFEAEKERYLLHDNDVENFDYQNFVKPLVNEVLLDFSAEAEILDFGAGTGPVIAKLLSEKGFNLKLYDPFFHPDRRVLEDKYDVIICCEVMEHFRKPNEEFKILKNLLLPNGKLYCMTQLLPEAESFSNWNYKNDITHVFFYSEKTITWIAEVFNFSGFKIEGRLIVFEN